MFTVTASANTISKEGGRIQYSSKNNNLFKSTDSDDSSSVSITPENFLNYFKINGEAYYRDKILTLTEDRFSAEGAGNATLKAKIDTDQDFEFSGEINIGNKSMTEGGADGLAMGFHTDGVDAIGSSGNGFGLLGLNNVFGFKWDTYTNGVDDPLQFKGKSFAGFIYSDPKKPNLQVYQKSDAAAYEIPNPSKKNFKPFKFQYTNKILSVTYEGETISKSVAEFLPENEPVSLLFGASTGALHNLQQIRNFKGTLKLKGVVQVSHINQLVSHYCFVTHGIK